MGDRPARRTRTIAGPAGRALTRPNPAAWLGEARQFEEAFDSVIDHAELPVWAEHLLTDLDDATLVAWAARHFGAADDELETQLRDCETWLEEHADLFLACAVYVQGVGQTLRLDLPDADWYLARTADKFVVLLDEQEAAEERLTSVDGIAFDPRPCWNCSDFLHRTARRSSPPPIPLRTGDGCQSGS